jgi:hypothetical protein
METTSNDDDYRRANFPEPEWVIDPLRLRIVHALSGSEV